MKKILYKFVVLVGTVVSPLSFAIAQDTTIYDRFEVAPEPIDGRVAYLQWLDKTIKTPETVDPGKANGEALLEFVVEPNGELSDIRVSSKLGAAMEEAIREAVAGSARWRSAMINGRPVRARQQMQIRVHPDSSSAKAIVFADSVEVMAEPPGGYAAFMQWIGRNYQYPHQAVKQGVSGRVKLRFIVEKDGSITQVEVLNDLGYGTGEEAIRVLKHSPRWKPASTKGKPVRSWCTLPITIRLSVQ